MIQLNHDNDEYEQFSLQNEQTGEVLNLYQEMCSGGYLEKFLARYPKGEEHWNEGSSDKIYDEGKTIIELDIDHNDDNECDDNDDDK